MLSGRVFIGRIDLLVPQLGWAVVSEIITPTTSRSYMAKLPSNDSDNGATLQAHYVEGTAVLCVADRTSVDIAYILCQTNSAATDPEVVNLLGSALYAVDNEDVESAENGGEGFRKALEEKLQGRSIRFQDYDHGVDIDAAPGDSDMIDQRGNAGVHVGRYVSQLRGSPACYVDASNITNRLRFVASSVEQHEPLSVTMSDKGLAVHDIAINDSEAFGLYDKTPLTVGENGLSYTDPNAIPLYRIQQTEGAAVDGKELVVVSFPASDVHYCTTEPPILAKKRVSLSGMITDASAASIASIKSPALQAIHQINYSKARSPQEQEDILQPWAYPDYTEEEQAELSEEQRKDVIDDAAINKIVDKLLSGDYLEKLKQKLAEHGLKVSSDDAQLAAYMDGQTTGPTDAPSYAPPPFINITDPVTGRVTSYFASTSFITQEADGSILITDGYGSEIRMSRGNIYISPALDLFLRPGRDLSAMVPRHQSYNAQQTTTINSSESIYIRAVNDLKMAGATQGDGMVTLECMAETKTPTNGLMLKSLCGTTVIGNDIYMGRNIGDGLTQGRVATPQKEGAIIIDACETGSITMRSRENMVDTSSVCLLASNNGTSAAIRVTPALIGLYSNGVEVPASVSMRGKRSQEEVTVVRNGQKQVLKLDTYAGDPQLTVGGALVIGGQFSCNGAGRFCGQLLANGVASTQQYCSVVDTSFSDPFKKIELTKLVANSDLGTYAAGQLIGASTYNYQDYYVSFNGFAFPAVYAGIQEAIRVPGMLWQANEASIRDGRKWQELSVTGYNNTKSMCYPGINVWTSNNYVVSAPGYQTAPLNGNYVTNVK